MSHTWFLGLATISVGIFIYYLIKLITHPSLPLPPGPRPWPILGNFPHIGTLPHKTFAAMAQKYGPLIRLKLGFSNVIVVASPAVAEQFFKVHEANFASRPPNTGGRIMAYDKHGFVLAPYGSKWRMFRKLSAVHLLSDKALDDFRHIRQDETTRLIRNLAMSRIKSVNLGQMVNLCITNALSRVILGRRIFNDNNGDCDPKADELKSLIHGFLTLAGVFNIADYYPPLEYLDLQGRLISRMKNVFKGLDEFITSVVEEHKTSIKSETHMDFLSKLLSLKDTVIIEDDGCKLDDIEIKALILTMFVAGTDTSAGTTEWAMAELIKNPKIMSQLQQEIDTVVGRDRLVTELDLPNLPYLDAIVKENFRLHPPAPLSLPRIASESREILGYHIPKGSTLLLNIWAIGRDPNEWSNPLEFRPERFLPGGEKAHVNVRGYDFEILPFGTGRRICAGVSLGIRFVTHMIATLAHGFDWELENGLKPENLNMDEVFGLSLAMAAPLNVHPRPRLSPHLYPSSSS